MRHYIITMYAWDANGNMTKDRNRGIASITYDARNNPICVTKEDGTFTDYMFDASGRKLRSAHPPIQGHSLLDPITINGGAVTQGAGNEINGGGLHDPGGPGGDIVGPIVPSYQGDTIEYCGNTVVENGKVSRVAHDKGYITFDDAGDPLFHYYLRDHLGSVRVVFNEEDSTEQVNHYYASGALMDTSTGSAEQPLKYNGKELLREWGMDVYDYGARWMLPVAGPMFMQPDPLCEKYYDVSPYSYCKGNFMNAIDPDGRDDYKLRQNGNLVLIKRDHSKTHTIYATDKNGKILKDAYIIVERSFIDNGKRYCATGLASPGHGGKLSKYSFHKYISNNTDMTKKFFEFSVHHTKVEWSHVETISPNGKKGYITTSHSEGDDVGMSQVISSLGDIGETLERATHSHSYDCGEVSEGDTKVAGNIEKSFPNASLYIYDHIKYIPFDSHSSGLEIVVTPNKVSLK